MLLRVLYKLVVIKIKCNEYIANTISVFFHFSNIFEVKIQQILNL
jgi:hypothetical protein